MASSLNKGILIGNLGKDPELRYSSDTRKVVSFPLATSESWKDKTGERREKTEWHKIVIFNENLGEVAYKYLKKGSKIYLEGQLQTRKWTDKENIERYMTEIVLQQYCGELIILDNRNSSDNSLQTTPTAYRPEHGYSFHDDEVCKSIPALNSDVLF